MGRSVTGGGGSVENCILAEIRVNNLSQDKARVLSEWTVSVNNGYKLEMTCITRTFET